MAGIDDVLERLVTDPGFRARLAGDPAGALSGYDLTADDLQLLSSQLDVGPGTSGGVEARTSKAGLFGLLGGVDEVAEAFAAGDAPAVGGEGGISDALADSASSDADSGEYHHGWIELNSQSQPVTETADPDAAEALAGTPAGSSDAEPVAVVGDLNAFELSDAEPAAAAHGGTEINLDGHLLGSGTSVSPQPLPTESVSFNFEQMKPTYGPADLGSATGASAPSGDAPGGWTPIVGDWNGDGEDAPTASREETITVHGNRTEDADSSHVVEDIALTYQKIELEHVGEASDPASLAAPAGEGAEAIRVDPAHLMVTGSSLSSGGGEPQAEAPETPGSHEVASASSGAGADGDVDGRDFLIWRRSPGGGAATDAGAALAAPEAVAEPGTAADGGTSTAAPAGPATETLEIVHAGSPDESPPEDAEAAATEEPG